MKKIGLSAAALAAVIVSGQGASAVQSFDGRWSIEIVTERGNCDKAYRYAIAVQNGNARYDGPEGFEVSGSVAPNGAVSGSIVRSGARAAIHGRLAGLAGTGSWSVSGTRECSGHWRAEKRG